MAATRDERTACMQPLEMAALRDAVGAELARRRCDRQAPSYGDVRGGDETLYGLAAAVNICSSLGLPVGDRAMREAWAKRILSHRDAEGRFVGSGEPGHALHMALGALNLLGEPIPPDVAPLAPVDAAALPAWLDRHDWSSTHKELCGQTIPLLASGRVDEAWIKAFIRGVSMRVSTDRPLETWCRPDDPRWRVISCTYHVLSAFDAGRLCYPQPELLLDRLLGLHWDKAPDGEFRTVCTDGDWAHMLLRLAEQIPGAAEPVLAAIRRVSARRVRGWQEHPEKVLALDTHHLYCYLWVTGVFQSCVRDHYRGGYVRDTLNDPALFRL